MSQQNQGRDTQNPGHNPNRPETGRPGEHKGNPQRPGQPQTNPNKKDERGGSKGF